MWEQLATADGLRSLIRATIGSRRGTEIVQAFFTASVFVDETTTLALAGAQLLGVAIARYILCVGPIAQMPFDDLVAALAPSIQAPLNRDSRTTSR